MNHAPKPDRRTPNLFRQPKTFVGVGDSKYRVISMFYNHKVGRNDKCPCGSKKKFKACCMGKLV